MPEPFKNLINKKLIKGMATHFEFHWPLFNKQGFVHAATKGLDGLELKARTNQLKEAMVQHLPEDYEHAAQIMLSSLGTELEDDLSAATVDEQGIAGWAVTPMAQYVGQQGLAHFELSMHLFKEMAKRASSEFGIRYFLLHSPHKTLTLLKDWTGDENQHVRRLVSEGTRPRLPWAMRLPAFMEDPSTVIALLERLKDDEKEYVRRSVANNLNDIAKDHPDLVAQIAAQWLKDASKERKRVVRHGCRTLIKNGHTKTLRALGYKHPKIQGFKLKLHNKQVLFGEELGFSLSISSKSNRDQALIIDYIIHHQKANGSTSPKVFKWRTTTLKKNQTMHFEKQHPIKQITTRVYYPGKHRLEILVNGVSMGDTDFQLIMP